MTTDLYFIAGTDLRGFVERWLHAVQTAPADRFPLRVLADCETEPDRAFFGAAYVMEHIAPRMWDEGSSRPELLLFGVLEVFGLREDNGPWRGCAHYVSSAFTHLHEIGEAAAADRLRRLFVERADQGPPSPWLFRAANALDPPVDDILWARPD